MPKYWIVTDDNDLIIDIEPTDDDTEPPYSDDTNVNQYLVEIPDDQPLPALETRYKPETD